MTGPPTPPLTTAAEIEDAARSSIPPQSSPTPPPSTAPTAMEIDELSQQTVASTEHLKDPYELLFPTLADLAAKGNFQELIRVAEQGDLSGDSNHSQSRLFLTAPLVLSYLILDDVTAARFALTRLPEKLASHALARELFRLLAAAWECKYESIYSRAEDVYNLCHQPRFPDETLAAVVSGLVTTFVESFRKRTFVLLSTAYTSIPLSVTQTYLGLSSEEVINAASAQGWAYDVSTQIFTLTKATMNASRLDGASLASSTLFTFNVVADSNVRLEL